MSGAQHQWASQAGGLSGAEWSRSALWRRLLLYSLGGGGEVDGFRGRRLRCWRRWWRRRRLGPLLRRLRLAAHLLPSQDGPPDGLHAAAGGRLATLASDAVHMPRWCAWLLAHSTATASAAGALHAQTRSTHASLPGDVSQLYADAHIHRIVAQQGAQTPSMTSKSPSPSPSLPRTPTVAYCDLLPPSID